MHLAPLCTIAFQFFGFAIGFPTTTLAAFVQTITRRSAGMAWVLCLFRLIESLLMLCVVGDMIDCHARIREPCLLVNDNTETRSRCPTCVMHHCLQVGFHYSKPKRYDFGAQSPGCPSGAQIWLQNHKRMYTGTPCEVHQHKTKTWFPRSSN